MCILIKYNNGLIICFFGNTKIIKRLSLKRRLFQTIEMGVLLPEWTEMTIFWESTSCFLERKI